MWGPNNNKDGDELLEENSDIPVNRHRRINSASREINRHPSESEPIFGRSYEAVNDDSFLLAEAEQFENRHGRNFKIPLRRKVSQSYEDIQKMSEVATRPSMALIRGQSMSDPDLKQQQHNREKRTTTTSSSLTTDTIHTPLKKQLQFGRIPQKDHRNIDNNKMKEIKPLTKAVNHRSSSSLSRKDAKTQAKKRANERRMKRDSFYNDIEYGHDSTTSGNDFFIFDTSDMSDGIATISSSYAEDDSTMYYSDKEQELTGTEIQRHLDRLLHVNGKKKLILKDMNLSCKDIPVHKICSYPLGFQLHKLSLSGNKLISLPEKLTVELTGLSTLDLSQCRLRALPSKWNLPNLKILNLSHNNIQEFFDEVSN